MNFGRLRAEKFNKNLAKGLLVKSGTKKTYRITDEKSATFLNLSSKAGNNSFEIHFAKAIPVHYIRLEEFIAEGQSVAAFAVDIWDAKTNTWMEALQSTTIGPRKILAFVEGTVTSGIRVRVLKSKGGLKLNEIRVY